MNTKSEIEIDALPGAVWAVFVDVERWPEWTPSVVRVTALDGAGLEVGKRFEIKQPWLPRVVWEVTEVVPGSGWTWRQRWPGATSLAVHEVVANGGGRTVVRQQIAQRGALGAVNGVLMLPLVRRYLRLEAAGLKARVEQGTGVDVPAA